MIKFLLIVLLIVSLVSVVAIHLVFRLAKRAKKAEMENKILCVAFGIVKEKAERLQTTLDKTAKVEGEANAERKELAEALNSDLVNRANNLFKL